VAVADEIKVAVRKPDSAKHPALANMDNTSVKIRP